MIALSGNKNSTPAPVVVSTDRETAFATAVPINDMNTSMTIEYSSDYITNGLNIDSMIVLSVENQSQDAIIRNTPPPSSILTPSTRQEI